uniref:Uncharacterized protein n=1 Tax=Vitis vinifera TaxID=29760 RepID=F6I2Q6_VITVI
MAIWAWESNPQETRADDSK